MVLATSVEAVEGLVGVAVVEVPPTITASNLAALSLSLRASAFAFFENAPLCSPSDQRLLKPLPPNRNSSRRLRCMFPCNIQSP